MPIMLAAPVLLVAGLFAIFSLVGWVELDEPGLVRGMAPTRQ